MRINRSAALSAASCLAIAAVIQPASAQTDTAPTTASTTAKADPDPSQDIVVLGIRKAIEAGLKNKRNSDVIIESLSAEDAGKLPDENLAEALQRLPGVTIDRGDAIDSGGRIASDGGEGSHVTIRGLGPSYNQVLFNGRRMATTEGDRSFGFDTIATDLLSGADVYKTQQAFIKEGSIGGTVNARVAHPLDDGGKRVLALRTEGNYEQFSKKVTPYASLVYKSGFGDDRFGITLSASYQQRSSINYEQSTYAMRSVGQLNANGQLVGSNAANDYNTGGGVFNLGFSCNAVPSSCPYGSWYGYSDFGVNRAYTTNNLDMKETMRQSRRIGGYGDFEFKPNDSMDFNLDFLYSNFRVTSQAYDTGQYFGAFLPPASVANYVLQPAAGDTINSYSWANPASVAAQAAWNAANSKTQLDKNGVVLVGQLPSASAGTGISSVTQVSPKIVKMIGFNWNWRMSDTLTMTFDTSYNAADMNNPGGNSYRYFLNNVHGDVTYYNTGSVPYWSQTANLANSANMSTNNLFFQQGEDYGDVIKARNAEATLDFQWKPTDTLTVRFGGNYEADRKSDTTWDTPYSFKFFYQKNQNATTGDGVTQAQWAQINQGLVVPSAAAFGVPVGNAYPSFVLNTNAVNAYAMNNTSTLLVGNGGSFPVSAAAQSCGSSTDVAGKGGTVSLACFLAYGNAHGGNPFAAQPLTSSFGAVYYDDKEFNTSFYVAATKRFDMFDNPAVLNLGLRYAHTHTVSVGATRSLTGYTVVTDPTTGVQSLSPQFGAALVGAGNVLCSGGGGGDANPCNLDYRSGTSDYGYLLPTADLKIEPTQDTVLRFGASRSLARGDLGVLAPYDRFGTYSLSSDASGQYTQIAVVTRNNPSLRPTRSTNLDFAVEWYHTATKTTLTFDSFYKWLDGLPYLKDLGIQTLDTVTQATMTINLANGATVNGVTPVKATNVIINKADITQYENSGTARVYGGTVGITQALPLGFGVQANYTYVKSTPSLSDYYASGATRVPLLGVGNGYNIVGFYERGRVSFRAAYNWRAKYLVNLGYSTNTSSQSNAILNRLPLYAQPYGQLDLQGSFKLRNNMSIYGSATNVTDSAIRWTGPFDNLTVYRANYGRTYQMGISVKF